jgi:Na+/melibiose symporter-like transporter
MPFRIDSHCIGTSRTLLIYYIEERLGFDDRDVAAMFLLMGVLGILVQSVLLKPGNDCLGERKVVMAAFILGMIHNVCYGLAKTKWVIFVGVAISAFVGAAFPTISAIKSNNVVRRTKSSYRCGHRCFTTYPIEIHSFS